MESQSAKLIDLEKESKPANLLAWFWKVISPFPCKYSAIN